MMEAFGWIGDAARWLASWIPTWVQIDVNERAIKHSGWKTRKAQVLTPGIRWYWPAFMQIEGPMRIVSQPLTTSTINVMDRDNVPVAARGFAKWRITDLHRYAVCNEDAASMLDDLVCAAIREVITSRTLADIQSNSRKTTDNALLREVRELTASYGVEIELVRLTTLTTARMICIMGDDAPAVVDPGEEDDEV